MEGVYAGGGSMQIHVSESYIWYVDDGKEGRSLLEGRRPLRSLLPNPAEDGGPNQGSSTGNRGGKDGRDG